MKLTSTRLTNLVLLEMVRQMIQLCYGDGKMHCQASVVPLRVPDIHEAQKHWLFTFCLIFLSNDHVSKIWMILFWPRVHRWEMWSQSGKTPPGGRGEIENVKYAKSDIINFNSATRWHFWTFTPLFTSMEQCLKKYHSDFWYIEY